LYWLHHPELIQRKLLRTNIFISTDIYIRENTSTLFLNWIAEISAEFADSGFVLVFLINVIFEILGAVLSTLPEASISIPKLPVPV
jgi:TRAP-type C4-dicarboxylate transport system permease large subunit